MSRLVLGLTGLILAGWALFDPYTFSSNSGDAVTPAPIWQTTLSLIDVVLIAAFLSMALRGRTVAAMNALVVEGLWAIAISILYIQRDGLARFAVGFAGHEFLSLYLVTFGLRLCVLLGLAKSKVLQSSTKAA